MLRRPVLSLVLAATLLLSLAVPSGAAVARRGSPSPEGFWRTAWEWIVSLLPGPAGCSIDPNGSCRVLVPTTDAGCDIDPNGRCRVIQAPEKTLGAPVLPTTDAGCSIDPDGRCIH